MGVPRILTGDQLLEERSGPLSQAVILDARRRRAYAEGHIPGAALVPFATFFGADRRYLQPTVPAQRPAVAYCEVGVRAALFALLHEIHTGEVIPVYDGSFMEWSLDPKLPVEL